MLVQRDQLAEGEGVEPRQQQRGVVGRSPGKTRCGASRGDLGRIGALAAVISAADLRRGRPRSSASAWAKALAASVRWLSAWAWSGRAARMKSQGTGRGALVHQLHEAVLRVGAGLAEQDRAGVPSGRGAGQRHVLAVALHLELLEMRRQPPQPVVVGQHAVRRAAQRVDVPDPDQPEQHRQVLPQRRVAEMAVHRPGAVQQRLELLPPDGERDHQADRRPQRIAAADPVAEAEGALGRDAEFADSLQVGRQRGEVPADRRLAQLFGDPGARRRGIGRVSSVVKVLEATRNSVRAGSSPCTVAWNAWPSTLDRNRASIRASVRPMVSASVATRGPRSEPPMPMFTTVVSRSPVAPRWLPSWIAVTKPRMRSRSAAASLEASSMPPAQCRLQAGLARRAQRHMHRGAVLGGVHHLAGEQAAAEAFQVGRLGQREQRFQRFRVDGGLRVVEDEVVQVRTEPARTFGIGGEQRGDAAAVRPCCQRGEVGQGGLASSRCS